MTHIIVAGAGRIGEQVATALATAGNQVVVVEADRRRAASLSARRVDVVSGNACVAETLEAAGGLHTDVLVACTGRDEENLVISRLAKHHLEIPRVVALVNEEVNRWLFDETWGVDAAISSASALVALIEEATGSARTVRLADLSAARLVLVEATVTTSSVAHRRHPGQLALSEGDTVAAVVRRGRSIPLDPALRLHAGDRVLVLTDPDGESRVHAAFYPDDGA